MLKIPTPPEGQAISTLDSITIADIIDNTKLLFPAIASTIANPTLHTVKVPYSELVMAIQLVTKQILEPYVVQINKIEQMVEDITNLQNAVVSLINTTIPDLRTLVYQIYNQVQILDNEVKVLTTRVDACCGSGGIKHD